MELTAGVRQRGSLKGSSKFKRQPVHHRISWLDDREHLNKSDNLSVALTRSHENVPPADDLLWQQLAALARIRADFVAGFRKAVCFELAREWRWSERPPTRGSDEEELRRGRKQILELARLSAKLSETFQNLNTVAMEALWSAAIDHSTRPPRLPKELPPELAHQLQQSVAALVQVTTKARCVEPRRRGQRKTGRPADRGLGVYIGAAGSWKVLSLRLLWDVEAAGGRLTLDKNSGRGTLLAALELLSPHLPPGFVPNVLPLSTLAGVKSLAKKIALQAQEEGDI
jgi:hypothetical protein